MDLVKELIDKICVVYSEALVMEKKIFIILDNARYQRSYKVQEYAKEK